MAEQYAPIAKDESFNTTDLTPKNIADVLKDGLQNIADSVKPTADEIPFDNTGTSLVSTDVEGAIKEVDSTKVSKSGDTMTGKLNIEKSGESYVRAVNTDKQVGAYLDADTNAEHGVWSNGYNNGSFQSLGRWLLKRGTNGDVYVNDTKVPYNGGTLALTSEITTYSTNADVAWGNSISINRGSLNGMLITGGRQGYGFQVFVPRNSNEYVILSNVNSALSSVSVTVSTVTLTLASSGYGSTCAITALKFD